MHWMRRAKKNENNEDLLCFTEVLEYIYSSTDNVLNMIKILQKFDVFCSSLTNDIISIEQLGPDIPMSTSEQAHWPLLMHSGSEREFLL